MSAENEKLVMEMLMRGGGDRQDASGIVELMTDDVVWQTNVPTVPPVVGRDACRAEIERQNSFCTGGLPGSEVRNIASDDSVVFTERLDVLDLAGRRVELSIVGVFEVRDGKVPAWREYFDMNSLAAQLGVEPTDVRTEVDPNLEAS